MTLNQKVDDAILMELYKRYNLQDYISTFIDLEIKFDKSIFNNDYRYINLVSTPKIVNVDELIADINQKNMIISNLNKKNQILTNNYEMIINSKGWKILEKLRKLKNKITKK